MVRSRRLELPRVLPHSDLNAARLPIPPRPHWLENLDLANPSICLKLNFDKFIYLLHRQIQCRAYHILLCLVLTIDQNDSHYLL